MDIKVGFEKAESFVKEFKQEHLLKFFNKLSEIEKENLLDQILNIDLELINDLYKDIVVNHKIKKLTGEITPLKSRQWNNIGKEEKEELYNTGMELMRQGKAAAFLVAGGQGTRLGHSGPKGTFEIGLPSHKSLFQLQCERLTNLSQKAGTFIPWYIMTSKENNDATVSFFKENNYFGYSEKDIFFLVQDLLPVVDENGKILMDGEGSISLGPNGNGGCFLALDKSGALKDMEKRGIEWVFVYGVDNALVRVADPAFLGYTVKSGIPASSKMLKKRDPEEKLGVFCFEDGNLTILEYSELQEDFRNARDSSGELVYDCGNIINYYFKLDFLKKASEVGLPYHVAHKKMKTIDSEGNAVNPDSPNAYKFEMFIFDIFNTLKDIAALSINRDEEFAPVKNKDGEDSPATAREMISELHKKWLLASGISQELLKESTVEVSPLISYSGEGLTKDKAEEFMKSGEITINPGRN